MTISTPTTATALRISVQRTQAGSCWACRILVSAIVVGLFSVASGIMASAPALQEIDDHEHDEGDSEQHHGDGRRLAVMELLQTSHDQNRRDFRLVGHVARDEDDRAVLAQAAGKG